MARLPIVENNSPEIAGIYARAFPRLSAFANQIKTLAHRPAIASNLVTLYLGFSQDSVMERRLLELAIMTVSHLNRCQYCVTHHVPLGLEFGLSQEQLDALEQDQWSTSPLFSRAEKLVIAYATYVTRAATQGHSVKGGRM